MADDKVSAPDMSKYYYRPGTTEPELRPEFAEEANVEAPAEVEESESSELKGPLPEDFPGHSALDAAGVRTYAQLRKAGDVAEIEGIGPVTKEKIDEALAEG